MSVRDEHDDDPLACGGDGGGAYASDDPCWRCIDWAFDQVRSLRAQKAELLESCQAQHEAIDHLFAILIERDRNFFPSQSGQPWEALLQGNAAIAAAEKGGGVEMTLTQPKCQCPTKSTNDYLATMIGYARQELKARGHEPNACPGDYQVQLYQRGDQQLWLCSACWLPGDTPIAAEKKEE